MAKVTPLADDQHLLRHVKPSHVRRDSEGSVVGVNYQAFELRKEKGEDYLSAAWVEYFKLADQGANIQAAIVEFRDNLSVKPSSRFAMGEVGAIRAACKIHGQQVRISHEAVDGFDSHASVRQINTDAVEMLELLAAEAWAELHEADL